MANAKSKDPSAVMDPSLAQYQPEPHTLPVMNFKKRTVYSERLKELDEAPAAPKVVSMPIPKALIEAKEQSGVVLLQTTAQDNIGAVADNNEDTVNSNTDRENAEGISAPSPRNDATSEQADNINSPPFLVS